jgi:soluble lytic murein transglycosylase-like protein
MPAKYSGMMNLLSAKHQVPLWIACRLISAENSDWNPAAISPKNADGTRDLGLMQHNSDNLVSFANWYRHGAPYDPFSAYDSVDVGLAHLRWLYETLGCWQKAVMAYNAGEGNVRKGAVKKRSIEYTENVLGALYDKGI